MKKYLLAAIMAVAVTGAFVSCSDDVVSGSLIEQKAKAFEETFIEAFGQPAPNHTWGFKRNNITKGSVDIITRGDSKGEVIKPDDPKFPGYSNERCKSSNYRSPEGYGDIVEPITDLEAAWVQDWFDDPANAGLSEEGEDFDNFFVQQVAHRCYDTNKPGYFWEIKDGEEVRTEKTYNVKMDQLRIGPSRDPSDDVTLHINDFNAVDNGGNAWNLIYVQGGSSKQFGYHASYDNSWQWKFRCVQLTVPGTCFADGKPRTGWYVGLSYWTDKVEVAGVKGERIGEDDVTQGNDWILKIVPGETEPDDPDPTPDRSKIVEVEEVIEAGRVFCEDLGASSLNDVDYNDVVFDAIIVKAYNKLVTTTTVDGEEKTTETTSFTGHYEETYAKIAILAAGGTVPANVCGHEVHNELSGGALGTVVMINTTTNPEDVKGAQIAYSTKDGLKYGPTIIQETVNGTTTDKIYTNGNGNPITCIDSIDIDVLYGNAVTTITAPTGAVPYKICVPLGTPWAKERVNIGIAYTSFAEYCGINPDKDFWNDITEEGSPASPVWGDCASPFTITNNGVTRYIDEGDVLSYTESEYTGGSSTKPGQIWPSKGAGAEGSVALSSSLFTGVTADANKQLCVYVSSVGNYIQFYLNWWQPYSNLSDFVCPSGWYVDNNILRPESGTLNNGRLALPLNSSILKYINDQGGCGFQSNYTITNITIE